VRQLQFRQIIGAFRQIIGAYRQIRGPHWSIQTFVTDHKSIQTHGHTVTVTGYLLHCQIIRAFRHCQIIGALRQIMIQRICVDSVQLKSVGHNLSELQIFEGKERQRERAKRENKERQRDRKTERNPVTVTVRAKRQRALISVSV
jgi:hypothetical protein